MAVLALLLVVVLIGSTATIYILGGFVFPSVGIGNCPSPAATPFGLFSPNGGVYPSSAVQGSTYWYNFSFEHCGLSGLTAGLLSFQVQNGSGGFVAGPFEYVLTGSNHALIAQGGGAEDTWSPTAAAVIPTTGFLSLSAGACLAGDDVQTFYNVTNALGGSPLTPSGAPDPCGTAM
jgi:hypothetical protein